MTVLEIMRSALGMPPIRAPEVDDESGLDLKPGSPLMAAPSRDQFRALEDRASAGEADAQFQLATLYYRGKGVRRDSAECLLWLTLAAEQGHPQAMADYGIIIQGFEPEEIMEAREMLDEYGGPRNILMPEFQPPDVDPRSLAALRAAKQGEITDRQDTDPDAKQNGRRPVKRLALATMVTVAASGLPPRPRPRSSKLAWAIIVVLVATAAGLWMFVFNGPKAKKSADRAKTTNTAVKNLPPVLPELPREITTSMDLADFAKIKEGAEKGDRMAQFSLGLAYSKGVGVPQDYAAARKWYIKAAEQDWANAQNNLGVMYVTGTGVPLDYVQAYKWFYLASRHVKGAIQNRNQVAMIMSGRQLAEALRQSNAAVNKLAEAGLSTSQISAEPLRN